MVRKLEEFVKDFKDKYSYKIIHVGTKKIKEKIIKVMNSLI